MSVTGQVAEQVAEVRERIARAAVIAGRDPSTVTLVAATKTVDAVRVAEVIAAGVPDVGENRAQELLAKTEVAGAQWHFLGQLQRNKVRQLAPWVACWESVDRAELGLEIAQRAPAARVLVQVNLGEEPQKGGCAPAAVAPLVETLAGGLGLTELSMGMTEDYAVAVEEGATLVRVGRAIFGARE